MKRRNADPSKLRRPVKRNKITEGIYGSSFLYLKFLMVWALVLIADCILEFRFEYLWPFWLLIRSVYDSFKYQGLAFSVFFVCVAITSDVVCYLFIPVQWLFFAASTYVWVQYVWHTERGVCLPTVSLWLLFVYIEASVRFREFKNLPFHMDLCRPFAAHCIGYPVVTLGFGFKSYISYRLRLRRQKEVEKENNFYWSLLLQALPSEQQNLEKHKALTSKSTEDAISQNGSIPASSKADTNNAKDIKESSAASAPPTGSKKSGAKSTETESENNASHGSDSKLSKKHNNNSQHIEDIEYIERTINSKRLNVNSYEEENLANEQNAKAYKANSVPSKTSKLNSHKDSSLGKKGKSNNTLVKDDNYISKLESDIKKLKSDLQISRNNEQEIRNQLGIKVMDEKSIKSEVSKLRQDNESLQQKLHNLVTNRQQDKQNLAALERKLIEERKQKQSLEQTLSTERKAKKAEEAAAARAVAMATAAREECSESCKSRWREQDGEMKQIKRELLRRDDQISILDRETQTLRQYRDAQNETARLMLTLSGMKEKNDHLENSLSAETRLKLDLFVALGEAKRQIEILQGVLSRKDMEIAAMKSKMAEVLALMPHSSAFTAASLETTPHFSGTFSPPPHSTPPPTQATSSRPLLSPLHMTQPSTPEDEFVLISNLNPNASDYTPKLTQ